MNRRSNISSLPKFRDLMPCKVIMLAMVAGLAGCGNGVAALPAVAISSTIGKAEQSAITPDQALARLKEGNQRFISAQSLHRDYPAQVKATSSGQYPFAAVLSCMDSRSSPEIVFDQGIGDLFVVRIAGNYAQPDIMEAWSTPPRLRGPSWSW